MPRPTSPAAASGVSGNGKTKTSTNPKKPVSNDGKGSGTARSESPLSNEIESIELDFSEGKTDILSSPVSVVSPRPTQKQPEFARNHRKKRPFRLRGRNKVRRYYESFVVQVSVAGLIFLNFIVACCKAQLVPEKETVEDSVFAFFEIFFGVAFTVELAVNMYGSWFRRFFKSAWNWFDFVIVIISLLALFLENLPGISVLRLFRAFRVFRLFKRVPSLRIIIEGVIASLVGVTHAFMILGILMGIWSIMGVEFYGRIRDQHFGSFMKAMFTMWQVMSMDSWCSNIARGITFDHHMPMASLFFISFLVVGGIIMTNVVVAILLEKYLDATKQEGDKLHAENAILCYKDKSQWKRIPKEERERYEYHKPIEGAELEVLEDMDKEQLLEMFKDSILTEGIEKIDVQELKHLLNVLWVDYSNVTWMRNIIMAHKDEGWMDDIKKPSFLLNILLSSVRNPQENEVTSSEGKGYTPYEGEAKLKSPNQRELGSIEEKS